MDSKQQEMLQNYDDIMKVKCPVCGRTFSEKSGERHI